MAISYLRTFKGHWAFSESYYILQVTQDAASFFGNGKNRENSFFVVVLPGKLAIESAIIKQGLILKIYTETHLFTIRKFYLSFNKDRLQLLH